MQFRHLCAVFLICACGGRNQNEVNLPPPIVGSWQQASGSNRHTYVFANDGSFSSQATRLDAIGRPTDQVENDAGSWLLDDGALTLVFQSTGATLLTPVSVYEDILLLNAFTAPSGHDGVSGRWELTRDVRIPQPDGSEQKQTSTYVYACGTDGVCNVDNHVIDSTRSPFDSHDEWTLRLMENDAHTQMFQVYATDHRPVLRVVLVDDTTLSWPEHMFHRVF